MKAHQIAKARYFHHGLGLQVDMMREKSEALGGEKEDEGSWRRL
jgi:hypothetical protein